MGKKEFAEALSRESELKISFVTSEDGKRRKIPIWFAVEGDTLQFLPMYGLKTKWYQDVEKSGKVEIAVKGQKLTVGPKVTRDEARIEHIKGNFAKKYGAGDVKRYYPTSEVAFEIPI